MKKKFYMILFIKLKFSDISSFLVVWYIPKEINFQAEFHDFEELNSWNSIELNWKKLRMFFRFLMNSDNASKLMNKT